MSLSRRCPERMVGDGHEQLMGANGVKTYDKGGAYFSHRDPGRSAVPVRWMATFASSMNSAIRELVKIGLQKCWIFTVLHAFPKQQLDLQGILLGKSAFVELGQTGLGYGAEMTLRIFLKIGAG